MRCVPGESLDRCARWLHWLLALGAVKVWTYTLRLCRALAHPSLVHANDVNRQVRRLITLVDIFYERGVKMVCLAEAEPNELFDPGPGKHEDMPDEVFAFGRTVSRLAEMQGQGYLKRRALSSVLLSETQNECD